MSTTNDASSARKARAFPARRTLPMLVRDPLNALEEIGRRSGGEVVRLSMGIFRPYLVTHPHHVQHILRDNVDNYRREGMMWKPLSRLIGEPSDADPSWPLKRTAYQALLTAKSVERFTAEMIAAIEEAVDQLDQRGRAGRPLDAGAEITRIVWRAITRVFFGGRISISEAEELGRALATATTASFRPRMLLPFVPLSVPIPGDRAFQRAVEDVDEIVLPVVRAAHSRPTDDGDIVSMLARARDENGDRLSVGQIRDGVNSLLVAATESTVQALTLLWPVLDSHPEVAARLQAEIDRVVGTDRPAESHLADLKYTKMMLEELVRVYPPGWIIPRTVAADDVIGGVRVKSGDTLIFSPYLTHRLEDVWERPQVFDPERFSPDRSRDRFAYVAFGGGPNQCMGRLFFTVEAQLIIAFLLSRFRPVLHGSSRTELHAGLSLRPRGRVEITLWPLERSTTFPER
ncbi:cytochrome P450 [Actinomadura sp. HBU206391]|uniref:cytochrome P450 n=1 Tax=Actinomadura sp. HBU206391 TaxID=2731692 RepID=UPI00164FC427|nr:cytochrome P450 [Actinomadura sp. HBU206391]MBC6458310.1 cytochrome P450 [Actinomadura sp. HBU206391]